MSAALTKLVAAVCLAEVCTMVGVFTFPALLPGFMEAWDLSNTQAGWISGVYFAAYALAAPVLVSLTDRMDARRVYAVGAAVNVVACAGFALLADGFWAALLFRALGGAALAGTYMPGLRVLVDRVSPQVRPRVVPLYTACFSLGTAGSYAASAAVADWAGWRAAFGLAAGAAALAVVLILALKPRAPEATPTPTRLLDFRPVLRNRPAMGYVLG
ncbi:Permease of the major facilitator superfamily [Caenispirillum salinarum AK4]|uniref:Permease of the major facilitator superfamily n=1 Tax=Caenispirillum salinarum AK4 TaxID=1238182 RepID=K9H4N7_9PROT|nr:MFS transporter [Caenispirillum salinarum]EKV32532.1 Permease of the major facilitator superfamily [Caenispirillum salinarum AK4]